VFVQQLDSGYSALGEPRRLTRHGVWISGLAWSPDGGSVIYGGAISWAMNPRLWRIGVRGQEQPERLDIAGFQAVNPSIAPGRGRLAFARQASNHDIWRYPPGGVPEPFLASSLHEWNPRFSPDGARIAFTSARAGDVIEIWTAAADGSNLVQLTREVGRGQGSPHWSPDGRLIAFDSLGQDGLSHIFVIDANGGRPRAVTSGPYADSVPGWSRDGRSIYFFSNRTGRNETWRVSLQDRSQQQVTQNGGDTAVESTDGKTLFYLKQGASPLFARPSAGGPERRVLDYVSWRGLDVFEDGIYYIGQQQPDRRYPIRFYKFSTGASSLLATVEGPLQQGLSVSLDRKTILFSKSAVAGADLMMIENFR
jgi:Tol biopolymer transport system component